MIVFWQKYISYINNNIYYERHVLHFKNIKHPCNFHSAKKYHIFKVVGCFFFFQILYIVTDDNIIANRFLDAQFRIVSTR